MKYAYCRVSTQNKQEFTRQEFALKDIELDEIFEEKISGTKKASDRPEFEKLLSRLQKGDTIYFESMSRMARSMQDLIDTTKLLANKRHCTVVFLQENITVGGDGLDAMGSLVFNIMGAFAQFERDLISDRTRQALQAKKEQGVILGKPRTISEETCEEIRALRRKKLSMQKIADIMEMPKSTVASILKRRKRK